MLEGFVNVLSKVFGSKHDRDVQQLQPVIEKIEEIEKSLAGLSHDQLRAKTTEFKKRIQDKISDKEKEKAELKQKVENEDNLTPKDKEDIYHQVDKQKKEILEDIKEELNEILPDAFAVIRETARRFKDKEVLE